MAKRKAAGATGRKRAGTRAGVSRTRSRAAGGAHKRKSAAGKGKSAARKRSATRRSPARKGAARKGATRKGPARKSVARKGAAPKKAAARKSPARRARSVRSYGRPVVTLASVRKVPALDRERRIVSDDDDDLFPSPPSSLDLDRTASAARSGRRELDERLHDHTEASPALTAGDVDADWAGAYATGDEAPGGDNPTPGQDIVDEIGKALGVQYEDNEELKGEAKISARDKNRWELDPASADDYEDR